MLIAYKKVSGQKRYQGGFDSAKRSDDGNHVKTNPCPLIHNPISKTSKLLAKRTGRHSTHGIYTRGSGNGGSLLNSTRVIIDSSSIII